MVQLTKKIVYTNHTNSSYLLLFVVCGVIEKMIRKMIWIHTYYSLHIAVFFAPGEKLIRARLIIDTRRKIEQKNKNRTCCISIGSTNETIPVIPKSASIRDFTTYPKFNIMWTEIIVKIWSPHISKGRQDTSSTEFVVHPNELFLGCHPSPLLCKKTGFAYKSETKVKTKTQFQFQNINGIQYHEYCTI
jgi:hypothetical protein